MTQNHEIGVGGGDRIDVFGGIIYGGSHNHGIDLLYR